MDTKPTKSRWWSLLLDALLDEIVIRILGFVLLGGVALWLYLTSS